MINLGRNRRIAMNLAATLGILLFTLAWLPPGAGGLPRQDAAASEAQPSPQPPAIEPAQPLSSSDKKAGPTNSSQTSRPHRRYHKKNLANCTNSPAPVKRATGTPADAEAGSAAPVAKAASTSLPPCAPPKKVVRNGGSKEPSIQLLGGSPAEQASHERSTEQLTAATQENLNQIAQRQLTPARQEMLSQVKQFMDQSKTAIAAGDIERGHNLAQKAHLLSQELLKP